MPDRILPFVLLIALVQSEPNVIDSLIIQLPPYPEVDAPHSPPSESLFPGAPHNKTPSISTTTKSTTPSTKVSSTTATTTLTPRTLNLSDERSSQSINQSDRSSITPGCPGVVCYTMSFSNGSTIFDCNKSTPQNITVTHELECNYWQPPSTSLIPITAKFFNDGPKSITNTANHAVPLRIVLKPRIENPNLRINADAMVPGALTRLVEAVRRHVGPHLTTPIKLSLIMIKIKRLTYEDLANVFRNVNMSGLILWNPDYLEETSFLQNADKISAFTETYVRLTFYCETENDFPALGRLWLPWLRWQVKFLQCRGHYNCYKWPREERLCCSSERCPETPGYVITHADKLAKLDRTLSRVHQQQVLDFYSCEAESDLTSPLVELKKRDNCWALPGYGMIDTTLRPMESPSTATIIASVLPSEKPLVNSTSTSVNAAPIEKMDKQTALLTTTQPALQPILTGAELVEHPKIRNLVIGIICLLLLNLITFSCFIVICCWSWRKFGAQKTSSVTNGSFAVSGAYEKQGKYIRLSLDFF